MLAIEIKVTELNELMQDIILVLKRQDERITSLEARMTLNDIPSLRDLGSADPRDRS